METEEKINETVIDEKESVFEKLRESAPMKYAKKIGIGVVAVGGVVGVGVLCYQLGGWNALKETAPQIAEKAVEVVPEVAEVAAEVM